MIKNAGLMTKPTIKKTIKRNAPAIVAVLALLAWVGCGSAPAVNTDTYYVGANGDDSRDGLSAESAFRTLKKALAAAREEGAHKTVTVIGTLNEDSEGVSEGSSVFDIRNTGDAAITIRGASSAKLSALNTGKRVMLVFGNARIRLENIEVSGGKIADPDITRGGGGGALVVNGAALIAGNAAVIRDNQAQAGGGVAVGNRGSSFALEGGEVRENSSAGDGGGILAIAEGSVKIAAGLVANNAASAQGGGIGVYTGASIRLEGGEVRGNRASDGGGLHITGSGTMRGGRISGNEAADSGGGVAVYDGAFVMQDGSVSGNSAFSDTGTGGGVFVIRGSFELSGGRISGNTANNSGGGVNANHGSAFVMSGGEIAGNSAVYGGSAVAVLGENNSFKKTGGVIYGLDAEEELRNVNTEGGNSVDVTRTGDLRSALITEIKRRRSTAGPGVLLDSSKNGAEGGWDL